MTKTEARTTEERLHAALASGARPPHPGRVSAAITFGWRGMLKIKHVPEQMIDVATRMRPRPSTSDAIALASIVPGLASRPPKLPE